jgi:hypothetical protein
VLVPGADPKFAVKLQKLNTNLLRFLGKLMFKTGQVSWFSGVVSTCREKIGAYGS